MRKFGAVLILLAMAAGGFVWGWRQRAGGGPNAQLKTLNDLTIAYTLFYQAGDYAKAVPLAERAVEAARRRFGERSPETAQALNDLGRLHQAQRAWPAAEARHREALAIREEAFHGSGPEVLQSLTNLAAVYQAQERCADAEPLFARTVTVLEHYLGSPTHPALAATLQAAADCLRADGKDAQADAVEARIKALAEPVQPPQP